MHEALSVDPVGIIGEYDLPFEFSHLSEKCHLNKKVNESHNRKVPTTYKEGSLSTTRGSCDRDGQTS